VVENQGMVNNGRKPGFRVLENQGMV